MMRSSGQSLFLVLGTIFFTSSIGLAVPAASAAPPAASAVLDERVETLLAGLSAETGAERHKSQEELTSHLARLEADRKRPEATAIMARLGAMTTQNEDIDLRARARQIRDRYAPGAARWTLREQEGDLPGIPAFLFPVGETLVIGGNTDPCTSVWIDLVDAKTGRRLWSKPVDIEGQMQGCALAPQGLLVSGFVLGSETGWVALVDLKTGKLAWQSDTCPRFVQGLAFSPERKAVVVYGGSRAFDETDTSWVAVHSLADGKAIWHQSKIHGNIRGIDVSGDLVLVGGQCVHPEKRPAKLPPEGEAQTNFGWMLALSLADGSKSWTRHWLPVRPCYLEGMKKGVLAIGSGALEGPQQAWASLADPIRWGGGFDRADGKLLWDKRGDNRPEILAGPAFPGGIPLEMILQEGRMGTSWSGHEGTGWQEVVLDEKGRFRDAPFAGRRSPVQCVDVSPTCAVAGGNGVITGFAREEGSLKKLWETEIARPEIAGPEIAPFLILLANGDLLVGPKGGDVGPGPDILVLDGGTGRRLWDITFDERFKATHCPWTDGRSSFFVSGSERLKRNFPGQPSCRGWLACHRLYRIDDERNWPVQ